MKFGHLFKAIMICVPSYEGKDLFEFLDRFIIKPHEITKDIDMKYMAENMSKRLHDDDESNDDKSSNKVLQKENITKKMASMTDEQRMKMLRKMVKSKKTSNSKSSVKKNH